MAKGFSGSHHTEAGNTNLAHNNREEEEIKKKRNKHIDQDKIKDNVYIIQRPIEEVYEEVFGDAVEEYNKKQRRSDRKIDNYYEHVKNSKTTYTQRESIVQVGNYDDIRSGRLDPELAKEILVEYTEGFQERNPNLILYNAVIHMDEATPHLHANFIPVGGEYQRGMDKQVAFNRALSQQNPEFSQTRPFDDWRQQEVDALTEIMRSKGLERVDMESAEHVPIGQFKEYKERHDKLDETETELTEFSKKLNSKVSEVNKAISNVTAGRKANEIESVRLEALKTELETVDREQTAKDKELTNRGLKMDDREVSLNERENDVKDGEEALKESQEALNSSQEAFDNYVKLMEEKMKEEAKRFAGERLGVREMWKQLKTMAEDELKRTITTATEKIDSFTQEIQELNEEDSRQL